MKTLSISLFFAAAIASTNLAADQLTLPPSIVVQGNGVTVQGQVQISNPDYAILSNTAFFSSTQGEGTYTDLVGPTFTVVPPHTFTNLNLGSYQFGQGTPLKTQIFGTLSLFYTLYSVDPNSASFDPIADYLSNDELSTSPNFFFIDQQANSGPPLQAAPVPEPGSWALAAVGLLLACRSLSRKHS